MAGKRNPNLPEGDDGRTIVPMDVDGMPWHIRGREASPESDAPRAEMTKEETRRYTWAAVKAALLVVLVFAVIFGLFIAFCDYIWFQ